MASPPECEQRCGSCMKTSRPMLCLEDVLLCDRVTPSFGWRLLVRRIRTRTGAHNHVCGSKHEREFRASVTSHTSSA
eukprot:4212739-Prymnesium_polylepis.1